MSSAYGCTEAEGTDMEATGETQRRAEPLVMLWSIKVVITKEIFVYMQSHLPQSKIINSLR